MKKMTEDSTAATLIWLLAVLALLASLLGCGPPRWAADDPDLPPAASALCFVIPCEVHQ